MEILSTFSDEETDELSRVVSHSYCGTTSTSIGFKFGSVRLTAPHVIVKEMTTHVLTRKRTF